MFSGEANIANLKQSMKNISHIQLRTGTTRRVTWVGMSEKASKDNCIFKDGKKFDRPKEEESMTEWKETEITCSAKKVILIFWYCSLIKEPWDGIKGAREVRLGEGQGEEKSWSRPFNYSRKETFILVVVSAHKNVSL